jgi:hypothetical protein
MRKINYYFKPVTRVSWEFDMYLFAFCPTLKHEELFKDGFQLVEGLLKKWMEQVMLKIDK